MKLSLIKMVFRRYRKIMIPLVVIAALAIALINGMYNAWQSLDVSMKDYLDTYGIADAVISTDITAEDTASVIRRQDGVTRVVARLTGSSQMITSSGTQLTAQIISMDKNDILRLFHWEEQESLSDSYVLADRWFAEKTGISAGETLKIRTGKDEWREFYLAGIVSSPETLARTKLDIGGRYYPDFGFVYAPVSLLETETEKESLRMITEWKEKEAELRKAEQDLQEAWDEGQAELSGVREELEKQEQEFEEKRQELREQIRQLTEGRVQLVLGQKELNDAEATAEERKTQLEELLERSAGQLLELEDRQAELTEVRNDLNSLQVRMEEAKGRLGTARDQITGKQGELRTTLRAMKSARFLWEQAGASGTEIGLPGVTGGDEKASIAEIESTLAAKGITPDSLNDWIDQAESGISQLESGKSSIQNGIARINRDYLPMIRSYLDETEQALEMIGSVHATLQNGIAEMEAGLKSIAEFERDAPDNREEISRRLREVEEGLQAIYSGLAEGETALAEGREQLEQKSAEAEEAHSDALAELEEGSRSLQEAWNELTAWEGYTPLRNELLIWFDAEVPDRREALKAVEEALDVPVQNSILYDDSQVAQIIDDNLTPMWAMSVLVPLLFVAIMLVVLFLFLSIMIRQSRQSIGILRALGFERKQVRRIFSVTCIIVMGISSVLGGAFSLVITRIFNYYYQNFFFLPSYTQTFNGYVYLLSIAAFLLLSLAVVAMTSGTLSRIQPAEAVSRPVAAPPGIGRFSRAMLKKADPLSKFSLLSLKRNPFRFVTSVICISGAVSMIFASLSFITAKNEVLNGVFSQQIRYDGQIVFTEEPDERIEQDLRRMESVSAAERFRVREEEITFGEKTARATLMFLEPGTKMFSLTDMQGKPMSYPTEGIVLSDRTAEALGVKTGDTVTAGEIEVKVTGISHQQAMECQFLPLAEADRFRKAEQTGWLICLKEGAEKTEITERLNGEDGYVTIFWRSLMHEGYSELFATFDLYAWMLVILCCVVAVFIVGTTDRNNLQEQQLSLSVLRTIGFQRGQISARWFLQSLLYLLCSLALGFAGGRITAVRSLELLSNSTRHLEYVPALFQYAWTAVCTFVFLLLGHLISTRSMKKWDLVENIKGRE